MKQILLFALAAFICLSASSQSSYSSLKLETSSDFKQAETQVLKAADYLFTTKFDEEDLERLYATEFIIKWMAGTPDYTFELNEKFSKAFAGNPEILNLYMSALAKLALEHPEKAKDGNYLGYNAVKMVIEYSNKSSNNLKQTTELKKNVGSFKERGVE